MGVVFLKVGVVSKTSNKLNPPLKNPGYTPAYATACISQ